MLAKNLLRNDQQQATILPPVTTVSKPIPLTQDVTTHTTFDDLVASHRMPPPGPDYYRARRQLWLSPQQDGSRSTSHSQYTSTSHEKLKKTLQTPGVVYSDSCWRNGIEKVWKGLSKGERLKGRLPLNLIIKVVHASWVRDKTWPAGMQAPEPDDEIPDDLPLEPMVLERIGGSKGVALTS
ncbi:hypothetical protein P691DRAFT_802410 [Macrolepiota fuliginosa MF-IS2]|uniref:DUF4050 domain-containing protein n=1 Tax=Macrolepiota fuliginosa MF-IS2 TaxID=1400762 RepID=A0A9P5XLQ3_9AGAR|nr:hypothetical protein P691DRAFT_802410 [Macrolepiota fuliginosa MF-IS2]